MIWIETGSDGVVPLWYDLTHAQLNPIDELTNPEYTYRVTKKKLGDALATEEVLEIDPTSS